MMTAASCAATILNISFEAAVPVRFKTFAPASKLACVTAGEYVSTETRIFAARSCLMTGINFDFCAASSARVACASVDSAPTSMICAPCAARTFPRRTAASADKHTLSRYHESADRFTTPMMAGCELKLNFLPPMENSFTRADAAARFCSSRPASCSSVSMSGVFSVQESLRERTFFRDNDGADADVMIGEPAVLRFQNKSDVVRRGEHAVGVVFFEVMDFLNDAIGADVGGGNGFRTVSHPEIGLHGGGQNKQHGIGDMNVGAEHHAGFLLFRRQRQFGVQHF